ncbi:MAG: hypothetical protein SPL08_04615 [Pseudomonadota bacterium]|nr:hypothetical protein [Pseudomonadota bacterium]
MKKIYTFLTMVGVVAVGGTAFASGIPTWGFGEVVSQMVDSTQSNAVSDLIQTEENLVKSTLDGLRKGHSSGSVKKNLKENLTMPSEAITGRYEGLQNILGKSSSYGQIRIKKCGANIPSVVNRIKNALTLPATEKDRNDMTTAERQKRANNRKASIESASTAALSKAWIVETEAAKVAASVSSTQEELNEAKSQMTVLVSILRLQEETQKNINTRLSLMGDELVSSGLMALDSGL